MIQKFTMPDGIYQQRANNKVRKGFALSIINLEVGLMASVSLLVLV